MLLLAAGARAATEAEAGAALRAAEQQQAEAARLRNRWIPAEAALKAAREALRTRDYDRATELAGRAEALARRSVEQAREQETAWRDAVIR
ncbi:hypothetical protein EXY23_25895 [Roseicella aquatilis]|uniref:DUF4398 domain-containing protein n=2 Tax=Roseicella aquatilis TaxID=2527868 RepID=A0A4R4D5R9_9PROT|nr:hypothetical protein EXY23_25895 [Roseicella aquatilis]